MDWLEIFIRSLAFLKFIIIVMKKFFILTFILSTSVLAGDTSPRVNAQPGQFWEMEYQATSGGSKIWKVMHLKMVDLAAGDEKGFIISKNASETFRVYNKKKFIFIQVFNPYVICIVKIRDHMPYQGPIIIGDDEVFEKFTGRSSPKEYSEVPNLYEGAKEANLGACTVKRLH